MTKSQRRTMGRQSKYRVKKTGIQCEECSGDVIRDNMVFICEKCGLTQDREYIAQVKSLIKSNNKKKNNTMDEENLSNK